MTRIIFLSNLISLLALPTAVLASSKADYINYAVNATNVLDVMWYNSTNGQWQDFWWNSANIITTLANVANLDIDGFLPAINYYFETTLTAAPASNGGSFLNDFYDDEGWYAFRTSD